MAIVESDPQRTQRLAQHYLIDAAASKRLSTTLGLVATALGFPHAQVNILDDTAQHTISDYPSGEVQTTAREYSMCQFTVADGPLAVGDLRLEERFRVLPGVRAGLARSYLGVPIRSREGIVVGTLCVFDAEPRVLTAKHLELIGQFGAIVEDQLEVMRRTSDLYHSGQSTTADLLSGLEGGEFAAWFQPVIDLGTNGVVGFEALARRVRADGVVERPGQFLSLAEDSDLIVDLDREVLRSALAPFVTWREARPDLRLAVNLSTRHLEIPDGVAAIRDLVIGAGAQPEWIDLELTETRALAAGGEARAAVTALRGYGFGVLLDDFGSGWSSLDWILGLPITGIKVDRAVAVALGTPIGDAVNQALRNLATEIDLAVVIEGIATQDQADRAAALGYRHAQGFHWTAPVPAAQAEKWLSYPEVLSEPAITPAR